MFPRIPHGSFPPLGIKMRGGLLWRLPVPHDVDQRARERIVIPAAHIEILVEREPLRRLAAVFGGDESVDERIGRG